MRRLTGVLCIALAGCGWNWNPWAGPKEERVGPPADATLYKCEGGKQLVVRYLDGGKSAMVILPDRAFRLDRAESADGARYSNGRATLYTSGRGAFLEEGTQKVFDNCETAQPP